MPGSGECPVVTPCNVGLPLKVDLMIENALHHFVNESLDLPDDRDDLHDGDHRTGYNPVPGRCRLRVARWGLRCSTVDAGDRAPPFRLSPDPDDEGPGET